MSERPYDWDAKEREATEHIRRQTAELRDELSKPSIQDQLTAAQQRVAELERENELLLVRYRGEYEALKDAVRAAVFTLEKALNE